ncbi:hypothetical protein JEZ13_09055 [bacterium]|nr:hypothetical protein [bacterium]
MKKYTLLAVFMLVVVATIATQLIIEKTDGTQHPFEINQIQNITFSNDVQGIILEDDFESYELNTFPTSGGWSIGYNGAGNQYQYITDQYSYQGSKSFRLLGASSWGAQMDNLLTDTPDVIYFEASFYSESTSHEGSFGLRNPNVGTWGTGITGVAFYDGMISIGSNEITEYVPEQWYKIRVKADLSNNKLSGWINDTIVLDEVDCTYSTVPYTHFYLHARNDGTNLVFFGNVKVWTE